MKLTTHLEALLFVAGEPLVTKDIARALQLEEFEIAALITQLQDELQDRMSGIQVLHISGGFQLSTVPECAETIARLLARGTNKLSRPALETIAIIAYRQPVTQPEIEAIRGVSVGGVVKTLLDRKLIQEAGRKQALGRPILYTTTPEFLHYFAIGDIAELPSLEEIMDGVSPTAPASPLDSNEEETSEEVEEVLNDTKTEDEITEPSPPDHESPAN